MIESLEILIEPLDIVFLGNNLSQMKLIKGRLLSHHISFRERIAHSRADFLKMLKRKPDMVIANDSVPELNGVQAFKLLRRIHPSVPFIAMTRKLKKDVALAWVRMGVDDFMLYADLTEVPSAVSAAIAKRSLKREDEFQMLEHSNRRLRALIGKQNTDREEECLQVATDLHDGLGQVLSALKIELGMLEKRIFSSAGDRHDELRARYQSLLSTVDRVIDTTRQISSRVWPLNLHDLGLIESLRWLVRDFEKKYGIPCETSMPERLDKNRHFPITIYRIFQEVLTNVAHHAQATMVKIHLKVIKNVIYLDISDNGKGIRPEDVSAFRSLGILGIHERVASLNGEFRIKRRHPAGTIVSIQIPLYG